MTLSSNLDNLKSELEKLKTALEKEQNLLLSSNQDSDEWNDLITYKSQIIKKVEKHDKDRISILYSLGFTDDIGDMVAAANKLQCTEKWSSVYQAMSECFRLNNINGRVISEIMDQNSRVLDVLTTINGQRMYGANGQHVKPSSNLNVSA